MSDDKRPSLRQRIEEASVGIVVTVVGGIVLIIVLLVLGLNANSGGEPEPTESPELQELPNPPQALQVKDRAVPDAKGPVREQVWTQTGARTFADPVNLSGEGPLVPHNTFVMVACKLYWPHPGSVAKLGYWYRLLTPPWKGLSSPANSYWNGDEPGKPLVHAVDWHVKDCGAS